MRIMITGGAGAQNAGDEALLLAAVEICRREVPKARLVVAYNNLEVASHTLRDQNVEFVPSSRLAFFRGGGEHYFRCDEIFQSRCQELQSELVHPSQGNSIQAGTESLN